MNKRNLLQKVNIRINIALLTFKTQLEPCETENDDFFPNINALIISCISLDQKNRNYLCFQLISQLQFKPNSYQKQSICREGSSLSLGRSWSGRGEEGHFSAFFNTPYVPKA